MHDTQELWTENEIYFWLIYLNMKSIARKKSQKKKIYTEALQKYQFITPTP